MNTQSRRYARVQAALFAVAKDIPPLPATAHNASCNSTYTPLSDILTAVKPILHHHGLWLTITTRLRGRRFTVIQTIAHVDSGEWFANELSFLLAQGHAHEVASLVTYGRRYLLDSLLNLELGCDDDGNAGSQRASVAGAVSSPSSKPTAGLPLAPLPGALAAPAADSPGQGAALAASAAIAAPANPTLLRSQTMANLWIRLKAHIGRPAAELVLQEVAKTSYLKLVRTEQMEAVCHAFEGRLAMPGSPAVTQHAA